jgi:hypothetical protein
LSGLRRLPIIRFSALFAAFVFVATSQAKDLDLWFIPMSQDGPAKGPLTKWVSENVPKLLPGVTVANNYGPPKGVEVNPMSSKRYWKE